MKLSARSLVKFSIFIIVYTGFGGTLYFLNGRLQELGLLFLIITFSYVALISALNVRAADLKWSWWIFATIVFISYTMMVPAFTFSSNTGTSPVPSMFSTRDFFAALFAGVLYFSYRSGISPQELEKSICIALGAIVLSYVFHYYRINLEEAYRSPIAAVKGMITYDEWRGYRLKGPNLAHTFCTLVSPVLIVREKQTIYRLFWILVFIASAWAWYLIQARALFAALILGLILYHVWFARRNRLPLFYFGAPVLAVLMTAAMYNFITTIHEHDTARYNSIKDATEFLSENPLLGFGKDNEKLREREIMNSKFYSSDIGIVGVAFRSGIPAAIFLVLILIYALRRAIVVNWMYLKVNGRINLIMFFFIAQTTGDVLNIFLSAVTYIKITGILSVAMIIGLTAIYRHQYECDVNVKNTT